ncbi:hypothetical protein [Nostoc sp. UHCC 0251]|uniref:hypothetical protein n=1 Tax=Nostoc sp. UHCC 0251 TaxID=3110240 RepID=UPI002B1EC6AF|nr:hypothetical protein [Nostoc sp. UHCC 0251]MEA5622157.1 hypothetical protein [Nostoc sp. UHCC 0251]
MKKAIFTTTLILCSMLIASCGNFDNSTSQQNKLNQANIATTTPVNSDSIPVNKGKIDSIEISKRASNSALNENTSINNKNNEIPNDKPMLGTIKDMRNGDLKCYVNVVDEKGKLYESVGASFDICEPKKYINKKVEMYYQIENVNDCQSSEPCGKTIKEWLITKIEIRD